jgi:Tfp pilus assembly protein PilV
MKARSIGSTIQKGSGTLEILIAFAILALALAGVLGVVFSNQSLSIDTQTNTEALYKANEMLEEARAMGRGSFASVVTQTPLADDIYMKSLTVDDLAPDLKKITSTVSWASMGRNLSVRLVSLISNPIAGSVCNPGLQDPDQWRNPQVYFSGRLGDFASANHSNGLSIADIKVHQGRLYVSAKSSTNNDHTFYVFDLPSNPNNPPQYLGSFDNDPNVTGLNGFALATINNRLYAFLASPSSFARGQLQIVDVTNPAGESWAPTITNYKLPLQHVPAAGSGKSIYYKDGYVYLGLTSITGGAGTEFNVIDVRTPTSPQRLGGYSVGGHDINAIVVQGDFAYLAHPAASSDTFPEQVTVLDVSNKSNPQPPRVSGWRAGDLQGNGKSLFFSGTTLYLGRTLTTSPNYEFVLLNAADPSNLSTNNLNPRGAKISDSVLGLAVRGDDSKRLAFLLTNNEFKILDITNPASIGAWGSLALSSVIGQNFNNATVSNCTGNYFYLGLQENGHRKDHLTIVGPNAPNSYSLSASGPIFVEQGGAGDTTITATLVSGFPPQTTFAASGLPASASASFSQTSCTPTCSSVLTISTSASTPPGSYEITVTGRAGVTTSFTLVVAESFDYALSVSPGDITLSAGQSKIETITAQRTQGSPQAVSLTFSDSKSGITFTPENPVCTPSPNVCTVQVTLTATQSIQNGRHRITVTGVSPMHTITFEVN